MKKKQKPYPKLLSERDVNICTGKALVGAMTKEDQMAICEHVCALHSELDQRDDDDFFGTEGWRHAFGVPDAD